jgi:hypothetical protein
MSVNLVPEDDLRAALRPCRVDPNTFEAAVRQRLKAAHAQRADDPLARVSPLLRSAAAFLPLEVLAGCKGTAAAAKLAPAGGAYKLLSYLAFPAISLFVLLGATIFSISKIRSIQDHTGAGLSDQQAIQAAIRAWWQRYRWSAIVVFVATMLLMLFGATWLLFVFYLISFGLLLLVLASFAKVGLGNRQVIGRSCGMGLMFLGQGAMISGIGYREIHFLDQQLVSAIFYGGVLVLLPFISGGSQLTGNYKSEITRRNTAFNQRLAFGFIFVLLAPLMAWMMSTILWPATPSRIKHYVESFATAPYSSASWGNWEIVARWAIDSKLDPDLSTPRRLLAEEISGKQDRYILSSALRVGLLPADQVGQLKVYETMRRSLIVAPPRGLSPQVITPLAQYDWVIRAAVLRDDLSPQERDLLEQRLHATFENMSNDKYVVLETALRVTQLLDVIGRPIDRDQYRGQIHDWLRKFHTKDTGGFQIAGGFKQYLIWPAWAWFGQPGSLEATSYAVELMEIYGIPDDLDLIWVRSFLRPLATRKISDEQWIAAATLARLNHLPGVMRPTWLEVLYYERTLVAAAILVGLCFYATFSSPKLKASVPANGSSPPDPQNTVDGQAG